jgi:hypothetical protein
VFSLGPNSPVPGDRLGIIDSDGQVIRRFEQIEITIDGGYVDFFNSPRCRPATSRKPLVDIDTEGQMTELCPHYTQTMGMDVYLRLLKEWAEQHGKQEYAI